jgi:deazaflavin-dependent oxidoreductase (nitroreductase family)
MSGAELASKKTVRLTTRGRRSGESRTVTIWFVADGPNRILVQHVTSAPANWYRNLLKDAAVSVDFGSGPINARATPISDPQRVHWSATRCAALVGLAHPIARAEVSGAGR